MIGHDRVGNVDEYFYDPRNRNVRLREYTGVADPDLPTTEVDNRPTGQLRIDDPPFFEISWEYNADSLTTRTVLPNLNEEIQATWEKNVPGYIEDADGNWTNIAHKTPAELS